MSRPRREEERRDATIRAVWACIARFGAEGTTIERVAEIGGFSKGVIHYYYDSKRSLLLAAFEAFLASYEREILLRLEGQAEAGDMIKALLDSTLAPLLDGGQGGRRTAPTPPPATN